MQDCAGASYTRAAAAARLRPRCALAAGLLGFCFSFVFFYFSWRRISSADVARVACIFVALARV